MGNDLEPIVGNWYMHNDKGQRFNVVAFDEERELIEIQHFDGDIEEVSLTDWQEMDIEVSDEPQNWTGPADVEEMDDLGTEITDTSKEDWSEPLQEYREARRGRSLREQEDEQGWDEIPGGISAAGEEEKD
ncbi:MAG: DUF6763 family protein [Pseudomonadota bacterium]